MSFLDTLSQMSALFLMVLIGYGCNRLGYMDKDFNRKYMAIRKEYIEKETGKNSSKPAPSRERVRTKSREEYTR